MTSFNIKTQRFGDPFTCLDCGTEFNYLPIAGRYERGGEPPNEYPVRLGVLCNPCAGFASHEDA